MIYALLSIKYAPIWMPLLTGTHIPESPLNMHPIPIKHGLPAVTVSAVEPDVNDPVFNGADWKFNIQPSPATADYAQAFAWVQVQVKNSVDGVFEIIRAQAAPFPYVVYRSEYFANHVGAEFWHAATWWCVQTSVAGELVYRYILNGMYYTEWNPMPKVNCYSGEFNWNGSPYPPHDPPWLQWPR